MKKLTKTHKERLDFLFKEGKEKMKEKLVTRKAINALKKYPSLYGYLASLEINAPEMKVREYLKEKKYIKTLKTNGTKISRHKIVKHRNIIVATNAFISSCGDSMSFLNIEVLNNEQKEILKVLFPNELLKKIKI